MVCKINEKVNQKENLNMFLKYIVHIIVYDYMTVWYSMMKLYNYSDTKFNINNRKKNKYKRSFGNLSNNI